MGEAAVSGNGAVEGLEPSGLWRQFEALTKIARASRHKELVIEHVRTWAGSRDLPLRQGSTGNLLIVVSATEGRESAPLLARSAPTTAWGSRQ